MTVWKNLRTHLADRKHPPKAGNLAWSGGWHLPEKKKRRTK